MASIGIVIKCGIKEAVSLGRKLVDWGHDHSHQIVVENESAKSLKVKESCSSAELPSRSDVLISLGGDGTLIGVARYVTSRPVVFLGVNFGNLGFLTEITPDELFPTVESVLAGKATIGERGMLRGVVTRGGKEIFSSQALNDIVIHKGTKDKLVEVDVSVDQKPVVCVRADGLIIATPTGSTAYSLAAGGSIVHPEIPVVLVTPICPHSLTMRPLIIDSESVVTMEIPPYDGQVFFTVDGQVTTEVLPGDKISVTKAETKVRFARSPSRTYFEILNRKLNWGIGNRAN